MAAAEKEGSLPLFSATDVNGYQVNVLQWRGRVVLLTIKYLEPADDKKVDLRRSILSFCNQFRPQGLDVVRIVSRKNIPFFVPKSYIEKRAAESNQRMGENYTIIIDWDHTLKKLLGFEETPLVFLIDRQGVVRWSKKGILEVDGELHSQVQKVINKKS